MALATTASIRDRVRQLLAWIDPVSLTATRFRDARSELKGDFRAWAIANPASAFRRCQVRNVGHDEPPAVSNYDFEERRMTLEILIAYPQDHRAGRDAALDRDDIIEEDFIEIDTNVGITGAGNFGGTYDCIPMGCTKEIERGDACDFLVIRADFIYLRALSVGGLAFGLGEGLGG